MLLASPIGATRRVLENWMVPHGHKVLTADTYDSASRQLLANPTLELIITEWLLGGNTAYDLLRKARQVTRVSDVAEVSNTVQFVVMVTPGWENARLNHQMDALKAFDQVVIVDKPINRDAIFRAMRKCYPTNEKSAGPTVVASAAPPEADLSGTGTGTKDAPSNQGLQGAAKETVGALLRLQAEVQQNLDQLNTLIE